jgi:hypothetical protein
MFSCTGLPTFDNANSQNATLIFRNTAELSNILDLLGENNTGVVVSMANVSVMGEVVCGDRAIRDEIARLSMRPSLLIGGKMSGFFVDDSTQCGDCGKLHEMIVYLSIYMYL